MNVDKLILKYNLKADSYYTESPYKKPRNVEESQYVFSEIKRLNEKYKKHIPKGWTGFNGLGYPMPLFWISVLEEFTDDLVENFPDIELYQQKIKFGGLRYYTNNNSPEVREDISKLEKVLSDKHLIY